MAVFISESVNNVQMMEINEIIRLEVTSFSLSILSQVRSIASILFLTDYFSNLNLSNDGGSLVSLAWRQTEISSRAKFGRFLGSGDFLLTQPHSCRAAAFSCPQLEPAARMSTSTPKSHTLQMAHIAVHKCSPQTCARAATHINTVNTNGSILFLPSCRSGLKLASGIHACTHIYTCGLFPVAVLRHSVHPLAGSQYLVSSSCCDPALGPLRHQFPTSGGCYIDLFSQYSVCLALRSLACVHRASDRKRIHPKHNEKKDLIRV